MGLTVNSLSCANRYNAKLRPASINGSGLFCTHQFCNRNRQTQASASAGAFLLPGERDSER